jgi:CubicO group peptidase (beta-lactamase class C family)
MAEIRPAALIRSTENVMSHKCAIAIILSAFCLAPVRAGGESESARVDEYVRAQMDSRKIPGLSLMVIRDRKSLYRAAYGVASLEFGVPASPETVYQIASATKSFTSTAVFQLVEAGKLKLTDTVGQLLPDTPIAWGEVTVHQLLTHTSGLPDVLVTPGKGPVIAETGEEASKKLASLPLPAKPGEKWAYNQTNYFLLLRIVEKLSGESLEDFVQRHIFAPLGMTSTRFGDSRDVVPGRATSYERGKDGKLQVRWVTFPAFLHSAAGINASAPELARWVGALADGRILKPATLDRMWESVKSRDGKTFHPRGGTKGYACGFETNDRSGHRSVGHSGGGAAAFRYFRDDKLIVVVLFNGNTDPDTLLDGIAAIYIPDLARKP